MAKEVNIHVKTTGTSETKQQIDDVARSTEEMGAKTSRAAGWMKSAFEVISGVAILTAIATTARKISEFFDNIKTRADEAVRSTQELRAAYKDLFEALNAFDEKSRKTITKETELLLQKTATPQALGLPIINAYTRQFQGLLGAGQITQGQYDQGLKEMLGWGVRHGREATPELISIMAGWGMNTPGQQGEFRRMISAASQKAGLTEEDMIEALSRGMPTIKALGWTPQQSLEDIATLAQGEVGRKKTMMPAAVLQALITPQLSETQKMRIPKEIAEDPQQLLAYLGTKRGQMSQKLFLRTLVNIYGGEAAPGVFKLLEAPGGDISETLKQAAGPEGINAEIADERARKTTLESLQAATESKANLIRLPATTAEEYMEKIRKIGAEYQAKERIRHPWLQAIRDIYFPGVGERVLRVDVPVEEQKENAAYQAWYENLTSEEKNQVPWFKGYHDVWNEKTPQQQYRDLMQIDAAPTIHHHNENIIIFNPVVGSGEDRGIGPRIPLSIK
ncbi:MAG: hypothetical protein WAK60_11690 [Sedimentisphaerales bacterium]